MAGPSSVVYFKHRDGAYVAADETDTVPFSWTKVLCKFVVLFVLELPNLVADFFKAYVWAPRKSINGRVVLVSGGANGLGRALCLRFAREGCKIAVVDIDLKGASKTVEEIRRLGMEAEAFRSDVSDTRSVHQLRKDIEAALGPVQILVNNAGLLAFTHMCQGTDEEVQQIINVNLASHFWMIRQFMPGMLKRKEGHIVAISSVLGFVPNYRTIAYSATKFGIRGMMASLSDEIFFAGCGNNVFTTCVYPNLIASRKDFMTMVNKIGITQETMSPEQAADTIVDGVLRNRSEIFLGSLLIRILIKLHNFCSTSMRRIYTKCICTNTDV